MQNHLVQLFAVMLLVPPMNASVHRQALIIGNDTYPGNSLKNARNDARAVAEALKSLGYMTMLELDADRAQLDESVDIFSKTLQPGDVALLYYSGHGMQVDGENYLIPVDF